MKRSGGLQRHKPLTRSPWTVTAEQVTAYNAKQRDKRHTAAIEALSKPSRPKDTGPNRATRRALARRSGDRCELCAGWLHLTGRNVHHRQPRGAGGSSLPEINALSCLLDLCWTCHEAVERNRSWAKQHGLLVPRPLVPAEVPADLIHGRVLLDDAGGWRLKDTTTHPRGTAA